MRFRANGSVSACGENGLRGMRHASRFCTRIGPLKLGPHRLLPSCAGVGCVRALTQLLHNTAWIALVKTLRFFASFSVENPAFLQCFKSNTPTATCFVDPASPASPASPGQAEPKPAAPKLDPKTGLKTHLLEANDAGDPATAKTWELVR